MCVPFLNIHGFLFVFCKKKGREKIMQVYATFWALLPPIIAIVLALITKEVYSSLFIGIVVGALFYSGFSFEGTLNHIFFEEVDDASYGMISVLSDSSNVGILIFLVILGTLPLFLILPIKDTVEQLYYNTYFIAFALLATGCLLYLSDRLAKGRKTEKNATIVDVLLVGVSQAIATVPGLSRSGTTIAAGLMRGFDRTFAVRYSFLLSLPAVLGANILSLKDAVQEGVDLGMLPIYLVGMVVSAVVGYFAIRLVNLLTDKGKFGNFAYYCWVVGALTLILSILL